MRLYYPLSRGSKQSQSRRIGEPVTHLVRYDCKQGKPKMTKFRTGLMIAAVAVAAALIAVPQNSTAKLEGKAAPKFSLKTTDGKTITNDSFKGKLVLLDFWASWCGPCKKATPTMEALHKKHSKAGLAVVGVNSLEDEPGPKEARDYKAKGKYTFTFAYDGDKVAKAFGVSGIPQFVLIDRKGRVIETWFGFDDKIKKDMEARVAKEVAAK